MALGDRTRLVLEAPAKVNLHLGVGARRADGYHDVTTVLHTLALADRIVLVPAERLSARVTPDIGVPQEENLAYRAAMAFAEAFGVSVACEIAIEKAIPDGAGLGGGSSDAAAIIAALAYREGLAPADERVDAVGRSLGADVPFFLRGGCALFSGRGDAFVRALPALHLPIALIKPSDPVSTAAAYALFDEEPQPAGDPGALLNAFEVGDECAVSGLLANNLVSAATRLVPAVADALALAKASEGVLGASVCGSGSAVFAIAATNDATDELALKAAGHGWWSVSTRTSDRGVVVMEAGESA